MENKLLEFQKRIQAIKKDGKNPHFKNTYATLPQILSEVKPILSDLGLTLIQPIKSGNVCSIIFDGDKLLAGAELRLPENLNPQQIGSAITYFRRYTLSSLLALEIEDDDAESGSGGLKPFLPSSGQVFDSAKKFLKDGGLIEEIEKKYTLSEETKEKLRGK